MENVPEFGENLGKLLGKSGGKDKNCEGEQGRQGRQGNKCRDVALLRLVRDLGGGAFGELLDG